MKAAIYCRVSSESQEQEGTSLQSQLDACLKLARERGYEVEEQYIIQEVYSGLTLDRPNLTKLRGWLDTQEVNAVVIYSSDRFSRDGYDFLTLIRDCQRADVELLCVTEPIEDGQVGELLSYVRGWASKQEAEKIRERTMRGKIARAKSGRLLGGGSSKLYGYNYVPGKGTGEGVRYPNEEKARWVREIYRWLVEEGLTVNSIVYRLRALGVPTPSGTGYWCTGTVHKILRNIAYTGKTYAFTQTRVEAKRHNKAIRKNKATHVISRQPDQWVEIPGATPPVISEGLFHQAQAQLRKNSKLAFRNTKRPYLLSSYVFCQRCGRRYAGWVRTNRTKDGIEYHRHYRCPKGYKIVSPVPCRNRIWKADYLEDLVWQQIEQLLSKPEIVLVGLKERASEETKLNSHVRELEAVEAQLCHIDKEKNRVWKAFELTGDEGKFSSEIKNIMAKAEELERRKLELERLMEASQQVEVDMGSIKRFCELVSNNLAEFSFENKRLALEALDIKVLIDGNDITVEGAIPLIESDIVSTTSWHSR